ncbi:MAG: hypothetical protein IKM39_03640, partial [Clostridia bacterium]|nr:hypothetical protein [Clostridia bacterium]
VFDYIYENKYANEFIAAGDSGAGYVMPSGLLSGTTLSYSDYTRPAENGDGTDVWVAYCKKFYERFDIKATGFIINGDNSYSSKIYSMYNQFSTMGSLHNGYSVSKMGTYQGVPYIYCHNGISDTTDPYTLYSHARYSSGGYKFSAFRTICLSPTKIQTIVNNFDAYAAGRGIKTQYVELYSFLKLAKESGRGATLR